MLPQAGSKAGQRQRAGKRSMLKNMKHCMAKTFGRVAWSESCEKNFCFSGKHRLAGPSQALLAHCRVPSAHDLRAPERLRLQQQQQRWDACPRGLGVSSLQLPAIRHGPSWSLARLPACSLQPAPAGPARPCRAIVGQQGWCVCTLHRCFYRCVWRTSWQAHRQVCLRVLPARTLGPAPLPRTWRSR